MVGVLPCVLAADFLSLPQRAGYSLQELFHLTRSQVSQQRALALHVLAQVISRVSGLLAGPACPHASSPNHRLPHLLPFSFWPLSPYTNCLWGRLGMG